MIPDLYLLYNYRAIRDLGVNFRPDISVHRSIDLHGNLGVILDGDYDSKN